MIKKCKHCGGEAVIEPQVIGWVVLCSECWDGNDALDAYGVVPPGPQAWAMTEQAAIDEWNDEHGADENV